jgi:hypothetical protein
VYVQPAHGEVDLGAVATEVEHRQCYEQRLAANPRLSGTVDVGDTCITEDAVDDPAVTDCVNHLFEAGGSVDVSVPFVFSAAARPGTSGTVGS